MGERRPVQKGLEIVSAETALEEVGRRSRPFSVGCTWGLSSKACGIQRRRKKSWLDCGEPQPRPGDQGPRPQGCQGHVMGRGWHVPRVLLPRGPITPV